jgi:signal transduction histidine kinase
VEKRPTFLWHALLILLPLLLLVAVGFYFLRQDKTLAEAEARERAQRYADELDRKISGSFGALFDDSVGARSLNLAGVPVFVVSTNGELVWPDRVAAPAPAPLSPAALATVQLQLWDVATSAEFTNRQTAIGAYRSFLKSNPPEVFHARAAFALGVLLGQTDEAKSLFTDVATTTGFFSEAGLPLNLLAAIKRVELDFATGGQSPTNCASLKSLCQRATFDDPTLLSEQIYELAERLGSYDFVAQCKQSWKQMRLAVDLYDIASKGFSGGPPGMFWIHGDVPYIAFSRARLGSPQVACYPLATVRTNIDAILSSATYLPDYFGVTVDIAGEEVAKLNAEPWHQSYHFSPRSPGGVDQKEVLKSSFAPTLASASGSDGKTADLKVNVLLTNKAALFKRQQARMFWFMCLIAASGAAGGTGLWRSWRAFLRQQQLNDMKSNFVSSVSHELRAPIASVRLLAEALDRGAVSEQPKQKEYFRFIVQECRRLTGLIENVLDFSRIEQGRKKYQFEEADLNALVEQTAKLMKPMADERGVHLELPVPKPPTLNPQLVCDGLAIQQALVNLIDNAIKHSPAGEHVVVALQSSSSSDSISLSVTDHGPGIPLAEHEKIFERFYRRGSELRRETQGIGIGLTIVKHVAEAHGGRVTVESAVGKGSKFTIELPVLKSA